MVFCSPDSRPRLAEGRVEERSARGRFAQPKTRVATEADFFIWIRCNALKRPVSAKEKAIITLTKVPQPVDRPGQAGANDVSTREVTPEMIRAGVAVLNAHLSEEYRVLPDEYVVELIYRAMASLPP
jgi:hypothetical protein